MTEQDKAAESTPATCRVFISYSHDSTEHDQRVRALADQLRVDGIDAWIDQYVQDPDEGWIKWMRTQVREAEKVLLVFTETYKRRFEGDEEEGKGLGATFEGVIVTQSLYESGGHNAKFRPVVFRDEDAQCIPVELRKFNRYHVDALDNYQNLLRWLYEAPRIVPPIVGIKPELPLEPAAELFPRDHTAQPPKALGKRRTSIRTPAHQTVSSVVRQQLSDASAEYGRVRASMPGGVEKIEEMEKTVAKMKTLAIAGYPLLKEFSESSQPGDRLVAIVMLQVRTNPDYIKWLSAGISAERAFIGYHAAVALLAAARVLDATHYATIREAMAASKQALGTLKGTDTKGRLGVLEEVKKELEGR
jgi:SEFIR domain